MNWECSHIYDELMKIIGKNRKILFEKFKEEENKGTEISFEKAKQIFIQTLKTFNFSNLSEDNWKSLFHYADFKGSINYGFLMNIFKERLRQLTIHPSFYEN